MARPLQAFVDLARRNTDAALARARSEPHAGNRCHFLAWTAHFADPTRVPSIAGEALTACAQIDNPYDAVALAAWPLHALAERRLEDACLAALPAIFERAQRLENPVNRLDALERLLHALLSCAPARTQVVSQLIATSRAASSWKVPRCLARSAVLLAHAPDDCQRVLARMAPGPFRRRAQRELAAAAPTDTPRFFG
jgi:hypothetical protein